MTVALRGSCWFGRDCLFDHIELRLERGSWTCLLGASGSGKTTLLRLLAGLDTGARFSGEIAFDGPRQTLSLIHI